MDTHYQYAAKWCPRQHAVRLLSKSFTEKQASFWITQDWKRYFDENTEAFLVLVLNLNDAEKR